MPPNYKVKSDAIFFKSAFHKVCPPCSLVHGINVHISSQGVLFKGLGPLEISFPTPQQGLTLRGGKIKINSFLENLLAALKGRRPTFEKMLWITDSWSSSYFHWISDALPKLILMREKIDADATLALPKCFKNLNFVKESLELLGIKKVYYVETSITSRKLWFSTTTAPSGNYRPALIRQLRHELLDAQQIHSTRKPSSRVKSRIYISRDRASRRKIVNEEVIKPILDEFKFITVYMEDYSFVEQIELMKNCEILIGNHGAGLVNMLFLPLHACVLELRRDHDAQQNCFFSLSSALELQYHYLFCQGSRFQSDAHVDNITVNELQLRESIIRCLSDAAPKNLAAKYQLSMMPYHGEKQ